MSDKQPVKLNLGCGDRKMYGFVNVDLREDLNPDVICDVTKIHEKFKDVDLIYACHVLEHFPKKASSHFQTTWSEALTSWYDSLKEGGVLRIAIPDFRAACEQYLIDGSLENIYCLLYGGQKYDFDFHFHCWDFQEIKKDLLDIGFKTVDRYDWRKTEHSFIDDYSQAYLPHMDKTNGKLMSLNVEAIK